VKLEDDQMRVSTLKKNPKTKALHGTIRALIANMIKGVVDGWSKTLELVGTGYRAELSGKTLILTVGYSHPVEIEAPSGIDLKVEKTSITVEGIDKELVGHIADKIRSVRPPEPYKGKGIKYSDEVIRRKAGKAAKTECALG
jgi:large subunit ribosomal protein L6